MDHSKVDSDIAAGNLGKTRDRLHGLISTHPDDLALRRELGDVYWKLQFPEMAGRYWYLEETKTEDMLSACRLFEKCHGSDPMQILLALKFRGDIARVRGSYAGRVLLELQDRAREKYPNFLDFQAKGLKRFAAPSVSGIEQSWIDRLLAIGCLAAIALSFILMIIGLVAMMKFIF